MTPPKSMRIVLLEILGPLVQQLRFRLLRIKGYSNISCNAIIERNVNLDRVYPASIYIGAGSLIASGVTILCHEHVYRDPNNSSLPLQKAVYVGNRCFIGVSAVILPGVKIGDESIIGAGSVVTKDIPSGSIAAGNPARIIRSGLRLNERAIVEKY